MSFSASRGRAGRVRAPGGRRPGDARPGPDQGRKESRRSQDPDRAPGASRRRHGPGRQARSGRLLHQGQRQGRSGRRRPPTTWRSPCGTTSSRPSRARSSCPSRSPSRAARRCRTRWRSTCGRRRRAPGSTKDREKEPYDFEQVFSGDASAPAAGKPIEMTRRVVVSPGELRRVRGPCSPARAPSRSRTTSWSRASSRSST